MIDLNQTRAMLLADIGAADGARAPLREITDPLIATTDACVRVRGHGRTELFSLLKAALSERFAAVARPQFLEHLLIPLRHALGNAHKHGNRKDPAKAISVEMVMARKGVLVAVTDEGPGFDAALTFRRFKQRQTYFTRHGCGFRNLHRARSTVSYENNGRTLLLSFRPTIRAAEPLANSLLKTFDSEWIHSALSAKLPEIANGRARLESYRVYAAGGPGDDKCGNRCVLRVTSPNGRLLETRILTGRLHATAAAAAADFEAATRLHGAKLMDSVQVPGPVARPTNEPRLVLYDFDSWMNLWEFLTFRGSLKSLRHRAETVGRTLAYLHRSQIPLGRADTGFAGDELPAMIARAETHLQRLAKRTELANRFRACLSRLPERPALWRQQVLAPIHGAFGWDCIHYGVDGHFYLYHFEMCRLSDPGLDLGGFAADLLCFTLANYDEQTYRTCHDTFLNNYNSNSQHPMDEDDLRFYISLALVKRLQRAKSHESVAQWLDALEAATCHRHLESEVAL